MADLFDNTILCSKCDVKMTPVQIAKNGYILRALNCPKCNAKIIHPKDEQEYLNYTTLRKKEFDVKLRFVGNSYAVSIPKEIINFMREQEKMMDDMVRLCLEDFGRVRLDFGNHANNIHNPVNNNPNNKINTVKITEINEDKK